jgi:hypothetical protein
VAQRSGFDMAGLSLAQKLLLGGSLLLVIDSFLPWNRVCVEGFGVSACGSANAWNGFGLIMGLAAIALLVWEGMQAMGNAPSMSQSPGMISAILAGVVAVCALLRVLLNLEFISFGAFIGLVLAAAIAYGGWLRYSEGPATTTAAPPPAAPPPPPAP